MDSWVQTHAEVIAARAEREMAALVAVSSPSGDHDGANEAIAVACALLPDGADVERVPCSSPGYADDLLVRVHGTGTGRLLLLGHLDTVVAHADHATMRVNADRLEGPGTIDMKGGDALALGVLRALAESPELYAQVALLLVVDEEWRTAPFTHAPRFAGFDACLCFEAGEQDAAGNEAVVVRRKAAATFEVEAHGVSAHSGVAPDDGRSALLALCQVAQHLAAAHDPSGPDRLTVVPTILHTGEALNVVPAGGSLICDLRADRAEAFEPVLASLPTELNGVRISSAIGRLWPGMDSRDHVEELLAGASARCGRTVVPAQRGGASDASHFASTIPLTVDGLGPRGGGAHAADEHALRSSLEPRAQVALALAYEALVRPSVV